MKKITKTLSLLYMLCALQLFGARTWYRNPNGMRFFLINDDIETQNTSANIDSACVKFDTTSARWFIDIYDSSGVNVWKTYVSGAQRIYDGADSTYLSAGYLHIFEDTPTADGNLLLLGTSDDASRFAVDEDGDVSADGDMIIAKAGDISMTVRNTNASGSNSSFVYVDADDYAHVYFRDEAGSGVGGYLFDVKNSALYFRTGGIGSANDRMLIDNSGKIGMGTITPQHKLSVIGSTPILNLTDSDVNLTRGSAAAESDTASWKIDVSQAFPTMTFSGSDGDQYTIAGNTSDQALFAGASGGYSFDDDIIMASGKQVGYPSNTATVYGSNLELQAGGYTRMQILSSGLIGMGCYPYYLFSMQASVPILNMTDGNVNIITSSTAQAADSSAITLDASLTEPLIKRTTSTGKNIRTPNVYEAWVTHEAATDTVTLGAVPTNYYVMNAYVWVQEAFDSDGADNFTVGFTGTSNAYVTTVDVSSTGVKTVTLGASARVIDATGRTIVAYYDDAGSDATTGEVYIVIDWIQGTANP